MVYAVPRLHAISDDHVRQFSKNYALLNCALPHQPDSGFYSLNKSAMVSVDNHCLHRLCVLPVGTGWLYLCKTMIHKNKRELAFFLF